MIFIDVDYPKLMRTKCEVIQQTQTLKNLLEDLQIDENENGIFLRSKSYVAIGCDLCQLRLLEELLKEVVDLERSPVLFVAEVSLTYMSYQDANAMINWASRIKNGKTCS